MAKLKEIALGWWAKNKPDDSGKGLYATLEELMAERRNVVYLHQKNSLLPSNRAGDVKSAFKGRGIEMEEIREYAPGDDVRDIDWRVTARKNAPYTKIYSEERDREIYVLLDLSSPMIFGTRKELKSVTAAKIAALLGWMAQENKDRFGAVIFNGEDSLMFKPQSNRAHLQAILKKISQTSRSMLDQRENNESLKLPIRRLTQMIKSRATVFVISDFNRFAEDERRTLAALSKKSAVFCVNVFDLLEQIAPKAGEYMAEYQGRSLVFDTRPSAFRQEYQNYFFEKRQQIRDFCQRFGCRYLEIRTDIPLFKQMRII